MMPPRLAGERFVLARGEGGFPPILEGIANPPDALYGIGDPASLVPGLAVIGARRATTYGRGCARRFARLAAEKGVAIVSGGARGCDAEAHRAALEAGGPTVAFLGGGCDQVYPRENYGLFQQIVDAGGAVVSEHPWDFPPKPFTFRERNRLIAGMAHAVLIVEAGLPSGTFSTADEALEASREVLVVPGSIMSASSRGSNRLLYQGAAPIVDDESFEDALFRIFGQLKRPGGCDLADGWQDDPIVSCVLAQPLSLDELLGIAQSCFGGQDARARLMEHLVRAEAAGVIARNADGRWHPRVAP